MKLSKAIEAQLQRIEAGVQKLELEAKEAQTDARPDNLELCYNALLGLFDELLGRMPEKWARHVIEELEAKEDGAHEIFLAYCYGELLTRLSTVTAVACQIVGRHHRFNEYGNKVHESGPLELPGELCQWFNGFSMQAGSYGIVVLHHTDTPVMMYRFDHWACEQCSYWHPGPRAAQDAPAAPFRACLLCGGFVGSYYERRARREGRSSNTSTNPKP